MKKSWKTRVVSVLVLVCSSILTTHEKAFAEETQPITINERTYKIAGFSRSIDPTATSACTSWNTYGTCLDFTTPEPKVMTIFAVSATQWLFESGKEFILDQVFYTYGKTASIQVIAKTSNSISLKVTPIRESAATRDHYFLIRYSNENYSQDTLRFGVIIPKSAIPVMAANCPEQIDLKVNGSTTFQIQTNFAADLAFISDRKYVSIQGTKYSAKFNFKDIIFESDAGKKNFSITVKSTVAKMIRERLYLRFNSVLNNPHPMELSPVECEILIETLSDRSNTYSWAWGDGSKSTSKTFSKDNLRNAYIVIGYDEFDANRKKLTVDKFLLPTPEILVQRLEDGSWKRLTSLSFTDRSGPVGVEKVVNQNVLNFAAELNCFRSACLGTEKFRVSSEDGVLNQILQIKFGPGYFDFAIAAPTQVIWGKAYTVSIRASKKLSGTCNFSSYYRGTVDQGTSKLVSGKASRKVTFLWGEEKSTVVQLSVVCKSGPYSVDKSILLKAFKK